MRAVEADLLPTEILASPDELRVFADEYGRFVCSLEGTSYFTSPDWLLAWWDTFAPSCRGEVPLWRDREGRLVAAGALVRGREKLHPRLPFGVQVWSNLGSGIGAADHCAWPVAPGSEPLVVDWLARRGSSGSILLRNLDPSQTASLVPAGARLVGRSPCPRIPVPARGEEMERLSPRFRKHLKSYLRHLVDRGVTFRWIGPEVMNERQLELLFRLHEQRQHMKGVPSSFRRESSDLHRRLIESAGPGRGPAAIVAEHDGQPIAMLYGFLWRDVFAYYQTGWDPRWSKVNIGTALVHHAISLAGTAGARTFDFLRGAEDYKYRFGATDLVDETWLIPGGIEGSLLSAKYRLRSRLRERQD